MNACQPVPTLAQRNELGASHARRYREMQAMAPEPANFCAADDTATLGFVALMREELGRYWPAWAIAWLLLVLASAVLTGLYFWVQP